ncbi:MAG: HAD hydrolase-like protein [Chitinivibrionales bacterium]|nr:HAD hydrolase-like protein [Chitinivibrionales bacterium]
MPCIGFDFDGTIADTKEYIVQLYNTFLSKRYGGVTLSAQELDTLKHLSLIEKIRFLKISPLRLPFLVRAARKSIGENIERIHLFPGMAQLFSALKSAGFELAIISSNKVDNIRRFLSVNGITVIDHLYCDKGYSLFVKSQTLRMFCKKHAIQRSDFVYVGDEIRDIDACRKEHLRIICVGWGWEPKETLLSGGPDCCVETPAELFAAIQSLFPD